MSLGAESSEFVDLLLSTLTERNVQDFTSPELEPLTDYISSLTISRGAPGIFSQRNGLLHLYVKRFPAKGIE